MKLIGFLIKANFLALYSYSEQRLSRRMLIFYTIPLTLIAAASAVFVIGVNT